MIKSFVTLFVVSLLFTRLTFAQAGVGLTALPPDEAKEYAKPLATFLGSYFNSGGYYSANLPKEYQLNSALLVRILPFRKASKHLNQIQLLQVMKTLKRLQQ